MRSQPKRRILSTSVLLLSLCTVPALAAPFAYIPNSGDGTVSVIDTATNVVVATIPVGGTRLHTAAVSPDGRRVYVAELNGLFSRVHVIDATTNSVIKSIAVLSGIFEVAVSPDGSRMFGAGGRTLKVIDTATNSLLAFVGDPAIVQLQALAVHPTSPIVYAQDTGFQPVFIFDSSTLSVTGSIGTGSRDLEVNPSGTTLFVTFSCSTCIPPPGLGRVDTATNLPIPGGSIATTGIPRFIRIDPSGSTVFATTDAGRLSVVDVAASAEVASLPIGTDLEGVDVRPDGSRVYVVDRGSNSVLVLDPATQTVTTTIPVGSQPEASGHFIGPMPVCGDGSLTFPEPCDDGNLNDGDGCSSTCMVEPNFVCSGEPSVCEPFIAQTRLQQRCINSTNTKVASLVRGHLRNFRRCARDFARGGAASAVACITADLRNQVARAQGALERTVQSRCLGSPEELPHYAFRNPTGSEPAVAAQTGGLAADLFGADLDATLVLASADPSGFRCQRELALRSIGLVEALWREARRAKRNALRGINRVGGGPAIQSPSELRSEIEASIAADRSGFIGRRRSRLMARVQARCDAPLNAADRAALFPGTCDTSTPASLAACGERAARCRFCGSLRDADLLPLDCDLFDDMVANGSCS